MDHEKIEQAVRLFLEGIGEDPEREGLIDTPDRIARMCEELYGGMGQDASEHLSKTFSVDSRGILLSIPPANITSFRFMEKPISPTFRMEKLWDSASLPVQWKSLPEGCSFRSS